VHTISDKKRRALVISRNFIDAAKEVLLCGTSASFINRLHGATISIYKQALLLSCVRLEKHPRALVHIIVVCMRRGSAALSSLLFPALHVKSKFHKSRSHCESLILIIDNYTNRQQGHTIPNSAGRPPCCLLSENKLFPHGRCGIFAAY
jgi:hypothetical protein